MNAATPDPWPEDGIEAVGHCPLCGSPDRKTIHEGLRDRLFGAPGEWVLRRCGGCTLGYLDPRPDRATIGLAYSHYVTHEPTAARASGKRLRRAIRDGYLTHRYGYRHLDGPRWGAALMRLLPSPLRKEWDHWARHLEPSNGARLLDVGCGNGRFLIDARSAGWHVTGVEPDPNAARVAQSEGIDVVVGSFDDVDLPVEGFDVISANQVIEHVHDPHVFVERLYRWLRPGGRVWLGTPNLESPLHRRYGRNYVSLHPPQHLLMFNRNTLESLLRQHGFDEVRFVDRGFFDYSQTLACAALERGLSGRQIYMGVRGAPVRDKLRGLAREIGAWLDPDSGSDLVVVAWKRK